MAILISQEKAYNLRNWLFAFILFELLKLYAQLNVYRAVRENELYLTGVSLRVRLFAFAVDNACFVWFLYGNVLYYTANAHSDIGNIIRNNAFRIRIFCRILRHTYLWIHLYAEVHY